MKKKKINSNNLLLLITIVLFFVMYAGPDFSLFPKDFLDGYLPFLNKHPSSSCFLLSDFS